MAKTSQLDPLLTGLASNYLIQVVDTSDRSMSDSGTNKRITAKQFIDSAITNALSANIITADKIAAGAITADKIATGVLSAISISAGSITADKIAPNAIIAEKIAANAITAGKIAANAITAEKIDAGAITADKIATGVFSAISISAGSITADKIAADAITANAIAAGAITAAKIAADAITANAIAANAITADKIAANAITADKIAANAITAGKIAAGAITANAIAANAITADKIAADVFSAISISAGSITADMIAVNAIIAEKIAAGAITAGKIAAGTITADKIAAETITADRIAANAIIADKIAANAITANAIAANAITANAIAADAITAGKIAANAITANAIAADAITAGKIAANAITAVTIDAGAITAGKIAAGAIASNSMLASNIIAASNLVTDFVLTKNIQSDNFNGQILTNPDTGVRTINVGTAGYYLDSVSGTVVVSKLVARDGIIAGNYIKYNSSGAFAVDSQGNLGVKVDDDTLGISNGSLVIKQVPSTSVVVATQDINYVGGLNTTTYNPIGRTNGVFTHPYNIHLVWDSLANVSSVMNVTSVDIYNLSVRYDYSNVTNLASATNLFIYINAQWSDSPTARVNSPVAFSAVAAGITNPVLPLGPVTYTIPKFSISGRQVATNRYLLVWPEIVLYGNNFGGTIGVSVPASTTAAFIIKATGQLTSPNNAFSTLVKPAGLQIS